MVQNSMIDGLNVVSTTEYPAEQFQRIEVLNGMPGALTGYTGAGYASAQPGAPREATASVQFDF